MRQATALKHSSLYLILLVLLVLFFLALLLASPLRASPAKKAPPSAAPATASPAAKADDAFAVPDGTPEELVRYLQKLGQMVAPARDPQTLADYSKKLSTAALAAAEKILAGKPNEQQATYAVYVELEVLPVLDGLGDKEAFAKLQALPGQLEKLGWPKLVRPATRSLLRARLVRGEIADATQFAKLLDEIKKYLAAAPLGPDDSILAVETGVVAERLDRAGLAVKVYEDLAKLFSASKDSRLARFGVKLRGAARRLTLVGKPLDLEGATPDGRALDWAKYRGKVVLVIFWATQSTPSRVELLNALENYRAYHDKGFEVVAVSTDQVKADLISFLAENVDFLPWVVLYDQALYSDTADKTMDTRYGIITIPELILVGKDGKVVVTGIQGRTLARQLAGLLGPPEPPKAKSGKEGKKGGE